MDGQIIIVKNSLSLLFARKQSQNSSHCSSMEYFEVFAGDRYERSRLESFDTKAEAERFVEVHKKAHPLHAEYNDYTIEKRTRYAKVEDSRWFQHHAKEITK